MTTVSLFSSLDPSLLPIVTQHLNTPFSQIARRFRAEFVEGRWFDALCRLYQLMIEHELGEELTSPSRLATLYILHDIYQPLPIGRNPFLSFFLDLHDRFSLFGENDLTHWAEQRFLLLVLRGEAGKVAGISPVDVLEHPQVLTSVKEVNVKGLEKAMINALENWEVLEVIPETEEQAQPDWVVPSSREPQKSQSQVYAMNNGATTAGGPMRSGSMVLDGELLRRRPTFSQSQSPPQSQAQATLETTVHNIRRLMNEAFVTTLSIPQQQYLLQQFVHEPKLVLYSGLTPDRLSDLIEHNQSIASEVLPCLADTNQYQFTEYLQALLTVSMTVNAMEVVHKLMTGHAGVTVPPEFLHMYISNGIRSCELIEDRGRQARQVRLVCVFIQSLIRNQIIDIADFLPEIQSFCIQFSRHRDATALYRMVAEYIQKNQNGTSVAGQGYTYDQSTGSRAVGGNGNFVGTGGFGRGWS